ncbi:cytospin-A isoform X2 [Drosophila biarmipes]|uniref:cytospin-A isoform X2 n=1 Tax=Drosophila biarmipes TaxID=125945 RepID=UPI0021CC54F9|nr:cytospin-A isoform X2 [Drosophila biarmipes]
MGSLLKEHINQIRAMLYDLKDHNVAQLSEKTGDGSGNGVRKIRKCMGRIILLTRSMRERFVESDQFCDQDKAASAVVLAQCTRNIKRLASILPLFQTEGRLSEANQSAFQLRVNSVLSELETVIRESPRKSSPSQSSYREAVHINTESPLNESATDELNELRLRLFRAEKRWELETIGHRLMISKERTLVLQARNDQQAAEKKLAEEQNRVKALEECLSQAEFKLRILAEQNKKLRESQEQFPKSEPTGGSLRIWNVQLNKRKCKVSSRGTRPIKNALKLNQSQQKTLKKLKNRLSQEKVTLVEAKSSISVIKKDIGKLRFGKSKLYCGLPTERDSEVITMRRLRKKRKRTLNVIKNLKWSRLLESVYNNLLSIREMWKRTCLRDPPTKVQRPSSSSFKSTARRLSRNPVNIPQLSQSLWDKIYKPFSLVNPSISDICLIRASSRHQVQSVVNEYSGFGLGTVGSTVSTLTGVPKYLGKTFGDRRLSLLRWCQQKVKPYGLPMYEFSASWTSGRALCAIIHSYHPDKIESAYLLKKNPKETLTYGVSVAQSLGVSSSIDLIGECLQKRPNFEKVLDFVEDLQGCLDPEI